MAAQHSTSESRVQNLDSDAVRSPTSRAAAHLFSQSSMDSSLETTNLMPRGGNSALSNMIQIPTRADDSILAGWPGEKPSFSRDGRKISHWDIIRNDVCQRVGSRKTPMHMPISKRIPAEI